MVGHPLDELDEGALARFARVGARLLSGGMLAASGGQATRMRPGRSLEFLDFRAYVPGDDVRRVDWRATARSREPVVRRYADDASSDWHVLLDRSASMGVAGEAKWRLAVQVAAASAYLLLYLGNRVGVVLFSARADQACPLGRGQRQYTRILRLLRAAAPRPPGGASSLAAAAAHLPMGSSFLVVSDFLAPDGMHEDLARLRARGAPVRAIQVLADEETRLPAAGPLSLTDIESGEETVVEGSDVAEAQAEHALARLVDALAAFCAGHGIPFTAARTDRPWAEVLLGHLLRRSGGHA